MLAGDPFRRTYKQSNEVDQAIGELSTRLSQEKKLPSSSFRDFDQAGTASDLNLLRETLGSRKSTARTVSEEVSQIAHSYLSEWEANRSTSFIDAEVRFPSCWGEEIN